MFDGDRDMWVHSHGHPWGHPGGFDPGPGMFLSTLNHLLWMVLLIGLALMLLRWLMPYIMPMLADIFDMAPADIPPMEILRQRYAAGEIDAVTFEQMRERLEASYPHSEPPPPS